MVIGKVKNTARLFEILRSVDVVQGDPDWNCVTWVREALESVWRASDALGTRLRDWDAVKIAALKYVIEKQNQHRFDGKAPTGRFDMMKAATYDALKKKETIE